MKNTQPKKPSKAPAARQGYAIQTVRKSVSIIRSDMATWKRALQQAGNADTPKRVLIQKLYNDITLDSLLFSQLQNRRNRTVYAPFQILSSTGTEDKVATEMLKKSRWYYLLNQHIVDSVFWGHSLVEFAISDDSSLNVGLVPRTNVDPELGRFYPDADSTSYIPYREASEYGTWLIDVGQRNNLGLINRAVPHVLMKKFAQSCWSELCEIYGIPPRVMKTNTQDRTMLSRAENMMRDMGAAAWFVIDETEEFEFAKGVDTNGDVYSNLITLCNNEMSLLISGAVIGQDTKNGNESKERASIDLLNRLVESDRTLTENVWNDSILPAITRMGLLPTGCRFAFLPQEDLDKLWEWTKGVIPYMEIAPEWLKQKFGIEVTGKRNQTQNTLSVGDFFVPGP